jgi:hypothetical protein
MVSVAFIKVMEGHFAKLYSKIDNLNMDISTLKTANLAKENTMLGNIRRNASDPEKQPPAIPRTPKKHRTIRLVLPPSSQRRIGTPLATAVFERNLPKKVEKDKEMAMNINESSVLKRPGRPPTGL